LTGVCHVYTGYFGILTLYNGRIPLTHFPAEFMASPVEYMYFLRRISLGKISLLVFLRPTNFNGTKIIRIYKYYLK